MSLSAAFGSIQMVGSIRAACRACSVELVPTDGEAGFAQVIERDAFVGVEQQASVPGHTIFNDADDALA